jgi:hypothetical protein
MVGRIALKLLNEGRIMLRTGAMVGTLVLAGIAFLAVSQDASLLDAVLWHKAGSSSAVYRLATVWRAVAVMQETYGLGAGLGSNRAFGTLAYIGSNLGICGLVVFSYMLIQLFGATASQLRVRSLNRPGRVAIIACAAAFSANLIGMAISGAEISDSRIWILWGMLLASLRAQTSAVFLQSKSISESSPPEILYSSPTPA